MMDNKKVDSAGNFVTVISLGCLLLAALAPGNFAGLAIVSAVIAWARISLSSVFLFLMSGLLFFSGNNEAKQKMHQGLDKEQRSSMQKILKRLVAFAIIALLYYTGYHVTAIAQAFTAVMIMAFIVILGNLWDGKDRIPEDNVQPQ